MQGFAIRAGAGTPRDEPCEAGQKAVSVICGCQVATH